MQIWFAQIEFGKKNWSSVEQKVLAMPLVYRSTATLHALTTLNHCNLDPREKEIVSHYLFILQ